MLESIGATDRHVRLVVSANGTVVGIAGAILGLIVGLAGWLAYRPSFEQSAHHLIGIFALRGWSSSWRWSSPFSRRTSRRLDRRALSPKCRSCTRCPVDRAPRQIHRSMVPGIVFLVAAFLLLGYAGGTGGGDGNGGAPELLLVSCC